VEEKRGRRRGSRRKGGGASSIRGMKVNRKMKKKKRPGKWG